jgi:hypothetical protein
MPFHALPQTIVHDPNRFTHACPANTLHPLPMSHDMDILLQATVIPDSSVTCIPSRLIKSEASASARCRGISNAAQGWRSPQKPWGGKKGKSVYVTAKRRLEESSPNSTPGSSPPAATRLRPGTFSSASATPSEPDLKVGQLP